MSDTPRTNALERAHLTPGGDPGAEHIALQWHALAVQLERDLIQQHREYLESVAYVEELKAALAQYLIAQPQCKCTDPACGMEAARIRARATLAKNPDQPRESPVAPEPSPELQGEGSGRACVNDVPTLERAIAYCKGQAMYAPQTDGEHAYDRGVAACVRMLEEMLPYPDQVIEIGKVDASREEQFFATAPVPPGHPAADVRPVDPAVPPCIRRLGCETPQLCARAGYCHSGSALHGVGNES